MLSRALFGWISQPYLISSDHQTWALLATQPRLHLDNLVLHAHEGWLLPIGAVARALYATGLADVTALAVSTLLWDAVLRGLQVAVADSVFGRRTALGFAAWSIVGIPGILPWALVSPCLHHFAVAWAFVLLWAWHQRYSNTALGLLASLGVVASLDNAAAAGTIWVAVAWQRGRRAAVQVIAAALPPLLILAVIHTWRPWGFVVGAPRVTIWSALPLDFLGAPGQFVAILTRLIPAGLLPPAPDVPAWPGQILGFGMIVAVIGTIRSAVSQRTEATLAAAMATAFLVVWACTEFALPRNIEGWYAYRYAAWPLPLLALVVCHGLARSRWRWLPAALSLLCLPWLRTPDGPVSADVVGWGIGQKLGDDLNRVSGIVRGDVDLLSGVGWGLCAALGQDAGSARERYGRFLRQAPILDRPHLSSGCTHAWAPGITPLLSDDAVEQLRDARWISAATTGHEANPPDHIPLHDNGKVQWTARSSGAHVAVVSGTPRAERGARLRIRSLARDVDVELAEEHAVHALGVLQRGDVIEFATGDGDEAVIWWIGPRGFRTR